jgi:hypothetical protein
LTDLYDEVFRLMDEIWASGDRLTAGHLAVSTDGTTSGEVLPKLRAALRDLLPSRSVQRLGLSTRMQRCIDRIDEALAPYEKPPPENR